MCPKMRVLFLNPSAELADALWSEHAFGMAKKLDLGVEFIKLKSDSRPDWPQLVDGFDAFITSWGSPTVGESLLHQAKSLKILGHAAGSVGMVASEALYARGVKVVTANPVMAEAVAEWSLLATLLASRRLVNYASLHGLSLLNWERQGEARDLRSLTVGVWGLGDISSRFLRLLAPLKPRRILLCSRHASPELRRETGATPAELEELLAESDIIHLLAALTPPNLGRIGARELSLIRNGATLINAGRARLVDEPALLAELPRGRISAILDVFHQEPLAAGSVLRRLDNVILTPHNAGGPGKELYVPHVLAEFGRFLAGEPLHSEITRERYKTMTVESLALEPVRS